MCGIYGLLSSTPSNETPSFDDFFSSTDSLLDASDDWLRGEDAMRLLDEVRTASYRFIERDGFVRLIVDAALRQRLEDTAARVADWVRRLEGLSEAGELTRQSELERINKLIVAGRDLTWQLERDALQNLAPVRALLDESTDPSSAPDEVWSHLWSINMVLNNIDRLEVRGRDSAGLGVFVRFADADACDTFLSECASRGLAAQLEERQLAGPANQRGIVRPATSRNTLLFTFKVAEEVGEMGDNVNALRALIRSDPIFQGALNGSGVEIQLLAHTRWASNGIVSVPNCHPVDSTIFTGETPQAVDGSAGALVAVLNGDIDNYQELYKRYITDSHLWIESEITTDAKIIPIVIGHHLRETGSLETAFRMAFDAFEGSMAIGVMAADRPGEFLFGQKGSGQGLYLGLSDRSTCVASEMYGLVELTQSYVKAEGEQVADGEVFHIRRDATGTTVSLLERDQAPVPLPPDRIQLAEITTRDINRGTFRRFFLKEISESVETVRKTIRGKFDVDESGKVLFHLGPEVFDPARLEDFVAGRIRRIYTIGQGTAAIAGDGIAYLLDCALAKSPHGFQIRAVKATELSAHLLRDDMSDTLIVAVSQSGTTTDTNRTVDMAKERGAWVIGIVNRRNSDLVYKSHGVLYTSDGRDIEMSVASTKAFYAQNVAGQILALALAQALGIIPAKKLSREIETLNRLPRVMSETLALGDEIRALANRTAGQRRHWALVGSGFQKIAANEIRIKLSELCYKSIACDFTEDKKHIDLSSEPFIIVCASGVPRATISDLVKEVAIFKAHQSLPIVVADEGEKRFDPYAEGVIKVPVYRGALNFLLSTMVGHLFGYHAASTFDGFADRLRSIRTGLVQEARKAVQAADEGVAGDFSLSNDLIAQISEFQRLIAAGELDGCVTPSSAVGLAGLFNSLLATSDDAIADGVEESVKTITSAINELARPIDAIKHQAKTVTVGISRSSEPDEDGPLFNALRSLELDPDQLAETHRKFLGIFEPLVSSLEGTTIYQIDGLDAVGRPRQETTIRVAKKVGCATEIFSRCETGAPLSGTKWGVVKSREIYLGLGQTDQRKILILPLVGESPSAQLVLFHVEVAESTDPGERLRALAAHRTLFERLKIAITERNQDWDSSLLESVEADVLFFESPNRVAEAILANATG